MRAYAVLVAAIMLTATSCELEQSFECIRPGTDRCPCVELQCDTGLSCVNGTCFDLSVFWRTTPSAGSGAASAGSGAAIMSVMTGMPIVSSAGVGGIDAAAGSGVAGGSNAAAGSGVAGDNAAASGVPGVAGSGNAAAGNGVAGNTAAAGGAAAGNTAATSGMPSN